MPSCRCHGDVPLAGPNSPTRRIQAGIGCPAPPKGPHLVLTERRGGWWQLQGRRRQQPVSQATWLEQRAASPATQQRGRRRQLAGGLPMAFVALPIGWRLTRAHGRAGESPAQNQNERSEEGKARPGRLTQRWGPAARSLHRSSGYGHCPMGLGPRKLCKCSPARALRRLTSVRRSAWCSLWSAEDAGAVLGRGTTLPSVAAKAEIGRAMLCPDPGWRAPRRLAALWNSSKEAQGI